MRKVKGKEKEKVYTIMTHFTDFEKRKIYFSEWFMKKVKDMTSEEFRQYSRMMNFLEGYEVIIVPTEKFPLFA